jgi:hypothetical protein
MRREGESLNARRCCSATMRAKQKGPGRERDREKFIDNQEVTEGRCVGKRDLLQRQNRPGRARDRKSEGQE